jgi:hypothetical protein
MKQRVLAIHWNDAASQDAWGDSHTVNAFVKNRCPCLTVGIEVSRDKHAVHVAASVNGGEIGGVWKIPVKMIRRIQVLGRVEVPE